MNVYRNNANNDFCYIRTPKLNKLGYFSPADNDRLRQMQGLESQIVNNYCNMDGNACTNKSLYPAVQHYVKYGICGNGVKHIR